MAEQNRTNVREMIGNISYNYSGLGASRAYLSVDKTVPDYQFWDWFRRCKEAGYELSALLADTISTVTRDWVLGKSVQVMLAPDGDNPLDAKDKNDPRHYTNDLLQRQMSRIHPLLLSLVNDLYGLGNQYLIVNTDGSFSVPSPDTVECEYDPLDYRTLRKVTVCTKLERAETTDTYTAEKRYIRIKLTAWRETPPNGSFIEHSAQDFYQEYPNLIGRLPVVHFANDRSANETHGRPIYAQLRPLFSRYNDLLVKALNGAELMGAPVPVIEGAKDVEAVIEENSEPAGDTFIDEQGNERPNRRIEFDDKTFIVLPEGTTFKFASPGSFTGDIVALLKILLLVLDKTRLPEVVWGNELGQARASSIEQMETFFMYIYARRVALQGEGSDAVLGTEAKGGLLELMDIWLRTRSLTDPRVVVAPCIAKWSDLSKQAAELKLKWVELLDKRGYITPQTAVAQAEIVEDAEAEVKAAEEYNQSKPDTFDQSMQQELMGALNVLKGSQDQESAAETFDEAA